MRTKLIILLFGGLTLGSFAKGCGNKNNKEPHEQEQTSTKRP